MGGKKTRWMMRNIIEDTLSYGGSRSFLKMMMRANRRHG